MGEGQIEAKFESLNPEIDLQIQPIISGNEYDLQTLLNLLKGDIASDGCHLVEFDSILLADVVKAGVAAEWKKPANYNDWTKAARSAATLDNGSIYGMPHWMCGYFTFARDSKIAHARSLSTFEHALANAPDKTPRLAGDFGGKWNLPSLYLNAWAQTNGASALQSAVSTVLDEHVIAGMKGLCVDCHKGSDVPCFDIYHNTNESSKVFAQHQTDCLIGYSESLCAVHEANPDLRGIEIGLTALGRGKSPLLFVDCFVMRKDIDPKTLDAAEKFTAYMQSANTYDSILTSEDAGKDAPLRYLLPATKSAFFSQHLRSNKIYQQLWSLVKNCNDTYSGLKLNDIHIDMSAEIKKELGVP